MLRRMNPSLPKPSPRSRMIIIMLFVLCLLGRPLLAIACDVHDATHHDVAELVEMTAGGSAPTDADGDSLMHDLLHVAHVSGNMIEMPAAAMPTLEQHSGATAPMTWVEWVIGHIPSSLLRPPISV
jgi:hypothetical protein